MTPDDHLARAKERLTEGNAAALLYAALDFRLCVESRLQQYATMASQFSVNTKGGWKAKNLRAHVERTFSTMPSVYEIEISSAGFNKPITASYIPISKQILELLGQTDNYLHAIGVSQLTAPAHTEKLRNLIKNGLDQMTNVISGTLIGPVISDKNGMMHFQIDPNTHPELALAVEAKVELHIRINVSGFLPT